MRDAHFYARILDSRYFPEQESFVFIVEDVDTKKTLDRPLQISKTAMLRVTGLNPDNPMISNDMLCFFAEQLKRRGSDNPIKIEWSDVDELSPYIERELERSNKEDEMRAGQTMGKFEQTLNHGLFLS